MNGKDVMTPEREQLDLRIAVDADILDLVQHEITNMRAHLIMNHTPFNPTRQHQLFQALRLLQGVEP